MKKDVHVTFKTDYETCWLLTQIAHGFGKTQPELINEICQNFIRSILDDIEKEETSKKQ